MTRGELQNAKRRALNIFDDWVNVTGVVGVGTGYYYELQSLIEDAVECGAQAACGAQEPLESEMKDMPPEAARVLRDNFWKLV